MQNNAKHSVFLLGFSSVKIWRKYLTKLTRMCIMYNIRQGAVRQSQGIRLPDADWRIGI